MPREKIKRVYREPEKVIDELFELMENIVSKKSSVQKIRSSAVLSAIIGTTGLALFVLGIEKVFVNLNGPTSLFIGLAFMLLSGVLFTKLK